MIGLVVRIVRNEGQRGGLIVATQRSNELPERRVASLAGPTSLSRLLVHLRCQYRGALVHFYHRYHGHGRITHLARLVLFRISNTTCVGSLAGPTSQSRLLVHLLQRYHGHGRITHLARLVLFRISNTTCVLLGYHVPLAERFQLAQAEGSAVACLVVVDHRARRASGQAVVVTR